MIYLVSNQQELFRTDAYQKASVLDLIKRFENYEEIGVDTETKGFDPYTNALLMIQIGDRIDQYVVDVTTVDIQLLKDFLESKILLLHNAKFDLRFLYHQRIIPKRIFDTYLAERVLSTGIDYHEKSLAACASRYCQVKLDKSAQSNVKFDTKSILYAANDVKYLPDIKREQIKKLTSENLLHTMTLDNQFVRVLAYVEYCGIYLNKLQWQKKINEDKAELNKRLQACSDWIIENLPDPKFINAFGDLFNPKPICKINWSSPKQCVEIFNRLGLDLTVIEDGKKKQSVDAKVLKPQKDKSSLVSIYLAYKETEKLCSTYGENYFKLINPVTKRIHTQFTQIMNTGRLSSGGKDKALGVELVNLQNIPADERTRSCFQAELGRVLIDADYSGQEQIVLANFSKEPNILEFYRKKLGDMHSFIASKIFPELYSIPLKEIKEKHPEKRTIAKSAGFAINYGGNGLTISENLSVPVDIGNAVYDAYFKAFPDLDKYFKSCKSSALKKGYIFFNQVTGRKSYIDFFDRFQDLERQIQEPGFWDLYKGLKKNQDPQFSKYRKIVKDYYGLKGTIERRALNYPIQGSSADITKIAAVYFMDWLEENNLLFIVLLCNLVHDEILVESPENMANEVSQKLKECMEKAGTYFCTEIPLEATPIIDKVWKH